MSARAVADGGGRTVASSVRPISMAAPSPVARPVCSPLANEEARTAMQAFCSPSGYSSRDTQGSRCQFREF
jgi:hypothetical protein